jgi:hypothetical protein
MICHPKIANFRVKQGQGLGGKARRKEEEGRRKEPEEVFLQI